MTALAIGGVEPRTVARPADDQELAAIVERVGSEHAALVPLGLGAHRALGHRPTRYDVALTTDRLARVVDYVPADMTITVESGVTVGQLQELLARERQWLPVAPPLPAATTVGGLVAADLGGPFTAAQGRVRDYLIGIAVVTADGRTARAGGRVVKNVAGYDLMKLFTGSLGTLAVITQGTFKVRPRPVVVRCLVLACADVPGAIGLAEQVRDARLPALAATLVWPLGSSSEPPTLVVLLAGVEEEVAVLRTRMLTLARAASAEIVLDDDADQPAAAARTDRVRDFIRAEPGDVVARIVTLPRRAAAVGRAIAAPDDPRLAGAVGCCLFDPRAGTVTIALATGDPRAALQALAALAGREAARVVVERWPEAVADAVEVWSPLPSSFALMRRMKAALDPRRTLAPGRFVGRL
jgi:glycolate oxidase FAD binding subunit